jgi:hypothetical protein
LDLPVLAFTLIDMRRNRPKMALGGIICIDLEFAIITVMLIYAKSYVLTGTFGSVHFMCFLD